MATYRKSSKPLWDTEGNYGTSANLSGTANQQAFLARFYLLHWAGNVQRFYWYSWDLNVGQLFVQSGSVLQPTGHAYGNLYKWMVGSTMTNPCARISGSSTVWTCGFTQSSGKAAVVVLSTSGSSSYSLTAGTYAD